jgi:hypothetical protein
MGVGITSPNILELEYAGRIEFKATNNEAECKDIIAKS